MQRRADRVGGSARTDWATRPEPGKAWGFRIGVWFALAIGRRASRLLLPPVCLYFVWFSPADRAASRKFLRKALGREPRFSDFFRHFHAFAATILDRFYLLKGQYRRFDVRVFGEEILQEMQARGEGGLLIGAHLGSFEIIRFLGQDGRGLRINLVMYEEAARKLNSVLDAIDPQRPMQVIALGTVDSMLKVEEAVARGEFAGMLADRDIEHGGMIASSFLGEPARFPVGPFRLAVMLRRPLVLMLGLYRGGNRYDIHFELLANLRDVERSRRQLVVQETLEKYVARLEHYCRLAPYNWFNFYDYWD